MKASEIIKNAMKFYVREDFDTHRESVYMCHAMNAVCSNREEILKARSYIYQFLDQYSCGTLHVALCRSDRIYRSYSNRYGFQSRACYSRRVKWFESLITQLEMNGL